MGTKQIKQSCKTGTEKGREYRSFKKCYMVQQLLEVEQRIFKSQ